MSGVSAREYHPFSQMIRDARIRKGWTQDELVEKADVPRITVSRYEGYKPDDQPRPEPENVRKVFKTLGLDPREAAVVLGYLTREEANLPPEPPRMFDPSVEEVIEILQDPQVPDAQKVEWVHYLRFRTGRDEQGRRRRSG